LLLLPLRGGAIAWALIIATYSIAGSIFIFMKGAYLFFVYPEWFIYGGIGMAVAAIAIINMLALSNRSYIWTRVCKFLWPFLLVISAIRGIIMIVQLYRGRDKIAWECDNGGQLWGSSPEATTSSIPTSFCATGFHTLFTVFIVSILIDLVFQLYMLFLNWRFSKRLEHYQHMKGPMMGGYYNA